jgi:hypothetical protein
MLKKKLFSIKQSKIILLGLLNPEDNGNRVLQTFRGCQVTLHHIPKELYVHQYCSQYLISCLKPVFTSTL